jgi:hypothetical protein
MTNTIATPTRKRILRVSLPCVIVAVLGALLSGCVQKYYTVNQYGVNTVGAEVLKEYEITPTVKASLK